VIIMSRGRRVAEGSPDALAGGGEEAGATVVVLRAGEADPLAGWSGNPGMSARREGRGEGGMIWRLEGQLTGPQRRELLGVLARQGHELLEWNTGLSALERAFRRLTAEEGSQREEGQAR
jgi:hypothetical protein